MKTPVSNTVHIDLDEDAGKTIEHIVDEDAPIAATAVDPDVVDEDINPLDSLPAEAVKNKDGSVTLPLFDNVELTTKKDERLTTRRFSELVFYRLKGADMRAINAAKESDMAVVAMARSTRLNQAVMNAIYDRLDGSDIANAGRVMNHFLSSGRKTSR